MGTGREEEKYYREKYERKICWVLRVAGERLEENLFINDVLEIFIETYPVSGLMVSPPCYTTTMVLGKDSAVPMKNTLASV